MITEIQSNVKEYKEMIQKTVKIPEEIYQKIEKRAEEEQRSMNNMITRLLAKALEEKQK
jgi:hypothetical protein